MAVDAQIAREKNMTDAEIELLKRRRDDVMRKTYIYNHGTKEIILKTNPYQSKGYAVISDVEPFKSPIDGTVFEFTIPNKRP